MTAVDRAELIAQLDGVVTCGCDDDRASQLSREAAQAIRTLLSEIEGLKAERTKGPEGDAVEPIERAIKALKRDIAAIQDAKKRGGSGASLTDCINRLPEIVRWLESGLFDVEAAFEQYEDAAALRTQAPDSWRPTEQEVETVLRCCDAMERSVERKGLPKSEADICVATDWLRKVCAALRPQTAESV